MQSDDNKVMISVAVNISLACQIFHPEYASAYMAPINGSVSIPFGIRMNKPVTTLIILRAAAGLASPHENIISATSPLLATINEIGLAIELSACILGYNSSARYINLISWLSNAVYISYV